MALALLAKISNLTSIGRSLLTSTESKIGEVIIDATHIENIDYSSEITDHPVEDGFSISDHIYKKPLRIRVEGSIIDTPISVVGTIKNIAGVFTDSNILNNAKNFFGTKGKKQITAFEILTGIHHDRTIIDVVCNLNTYSNMVIESLTFPRDNRTGNRLLFEVALKQITLAKVKTVTISSNPRNVQDMLNNKTNLGIQQTTEPDENQKGSASILHKVIFGG